MNLYLDAILPRGASTNDRIRGCTTPKLISNIKESIGEGDDMDIDALDGYDELEAGEQEKIQRAFEQGHVDDEDWKGVSSSSLLSSLVSCLNTSSPHFYVFLFLCGQCLPSALLRFVSIGTFRQSVLTPPPGCRSEPSRLDGIPQAYL